MHWSTTAHRIIIRPTKWLCVEDAQVKKWVTDNCTVFRYFLLIYLFCVLFVFVYFFCYNFVCLFVSFFLKFGVQAEESRSTARSLPFQYFISFIVFSGNYVHTRGKSCPFVFPSQLRQTLLHWLFIIPQSNIAFTSCQASQSDKISKPKIKATADKRLKQKYFLAVVLLSWL